jgi:peptidyl-prolyl cis-trans isomerase A (cyclophilin A)
VRALVALLLGIAALATESQAPQPRRDLTNPAAFTETSPATYVVRLDTTIGEILIRVTRAWSPHGADRFYNLVKAGFYDDCRFFRVVPNFMAQFGIHGDPAVAKAWDKAFIPAERARVSNTRGRVSFAMTQLASTRSTQVFINFGDNSKLDIDGFAPFGESLTRMALVEQIYDKYGELIPQSLIVAGGNALLRTVAPKLDFIRTATIVDP